MNGLPSAASSLGQKAESVFSSPAGARRDRAALVASRRKLEESRQKALRRSAEEATRRSIERKAKESPSARKELRFSGQPPGSAPATARTVDSSATHSVGSPVQDERLQALERRFDKFSFDFESLSEDTAIRQSVLQEQQEKILNLLTAQSKSESAAPLPRQGGGGESDRAERLRRSRRDGKLVCSEEEFDILLGSVGKTSAKVLPPPRLSISSKGFGSYYEDFPTTTEDGGYSSALMDEQRAMRANKSRMTKVFASEAAFHEHLVTRGHLQRSSPHYLFFSTLLFQTRELSLRDGSWATSKAYLTRLWTTQANEGREWLELVGETSAKRYADGILPEFANHIEAVKYNILREELKSKRKNPKDPQKEKFSGSAKQTKDNDFFCEYHNSWYPSATHKDQCRKTGKQRPGARNGP